MQLEKLNDFKGKMNHIIHFFEIIEQIPGSKYEMITKHHQLKQKHREIQELLPDIIETINSIEVDKEETSTN